jgi:hypothetical protein
MKPHRVDYSSHEDIGPKQQGRWPLLIEMMIDERRGVAGFGLLPSYTYMGGSFVNEQISILIDTNHHINTSTLSPS